MPDKDAFLERFDQLKSVVYGGYHGELEKDDRYYRGEYARDIVPEAWNDAAMSPIILSTAYDAVENQADHILTSPKIFVPARPTTKEKLDEQQIAEGKRKFLEAFWHQVRTHCGDPLLHGKKKLIKDGKLVLKKTVRWDLVPDYPDNATRPAKRKWQRDFAKALKSKFPWDVRVVPNETVYEDPDNPHDPQYVYESYDIRISEALRLYPNSVGNWKHQGLFDRVQYVEMWTKPHGDDPGKFCVWITDELVHDEENPYHWGDEGNYDGYVPYAIRDSGWGDVDSENKPEDRYVGVLRYMRPTLEAQARIMTGAEAQLRISTFPMVTTTNMPEAEDGELPLEVGPGKVNNKSEEQLIEIMPWPQMPDVWQALDKVQREADRLSKFNVLGGTPQKGVDSATEADMNVRNAASRLTGPVAALQGIAETIDRWALQDIENVFEAGVTLYGAVESGQSEHTLLPSDIRGYYETFVEFSTTDQAALDMRNAKIWADLSKQFVGLSQVTAMEKAGIVDPMNEMVKAAIERVFMSQEFEAARKMTALQGMGSAGQMAMQMMMQAGLGKSGGGGLAGDQAMPGANTAGNPIVQDAQQNAGVDQAASQYGGG